MRLILCRQRDVQVQLDRDVLAPSRSSLGPRHAGTSFTDAVACAMMCGSSSPLVLMRASRSECEPTRTWLRLLPPNRDTSARTRSGRRERLVGRVRLWTAHKCPRVSPSRRNVEGWHTTDTLKQARARHCAWPSRRKL